jgi:hypothetical protein
MEFVNFRSEISSNVPYNSDLTTFSTTASDANGVHRKGENSRYNKE